MKALLTLLIVTSAHAGHSCKDADGRYWFQDEPCARGMVEEPFPFVLPDNGPVPEFWLPGEPATEGSTVYRRRHHHGGRGGHSGRWGKS
jgi:hypothetical protein